MAPTTDNNARDERSVPRPEPSDILKRFYALYDVEGRYFMKKVSKLYYFLIQKIEIFLGSRISKFLRPAHRYDDFKTYQKSLAKPLVMAKLNMAYLSSLKKPSKTAVVLIAGVTISGTPCPRHIIVPFGAEAPSGHVAQA